MRPNRRQESAPDTQDAAKQLLFDVEQKIQHDLDDESNGKAT
jgi:hypothetical protein